MTLPGPNDHYINLQTAIEMTSLYRTNREILLADSFQDKGILPLSETFNRSAIDELLSTPGCVAIRLYGGQDEEDKVHTILVAVNSSNEDILPVDNLKGDDPVIIEMGQRCPNTCPPASPLNS